MQIFYAVVNMQIDAAAAAKFGFGHIPQILGDLKTAIRPLLHLPQGLIIIGNGKQKIIADVSRRQILFHFYRRTTGDDINPVTTLRCQPTKSCKIFRFLIDNAVIVQTEFQFLTIHRHPRNYPATNL